MGEIQYLIYQLENGGDLRGLRFEPLEQVKAAGGAVEWGNYNHMYTGAIDPADFVGHSLSVSDVVVLRRDGKAGAYYVDNDGFSDVSEFLAAPYRYYSTQRPVDIGTFPKTESGPVKLVNYEQREYCENATFRAWGYVAYDAPLTEKQAADYELRPAADNPDREPISPSQWEAQLQVIGKYEDSKHMNLYKRLTWLYKDMGVYVKHENVPTARVAERFTEIMDIKARAAENLAARNRPIAERLAEGAERAARENADRPVPAPGDKREER